MASLQLCAREQPNRQRGRGKRKGGSLQFLGHHPASCTESRTSPELSIVLPVQRACFKQLDLTPKPDCPIVSFCANFAGFTLGQTGSSNHAREARVRREANKLIGSVRQKFLGPPPVLPTLGYAHQSFGRGEESARLFPSSVARRAECAANEFRRCCVSEIDNLSGQASRACSRRVVSTARRLSQLGLRASGSD